MLTVSYNASTSATEVLCRASHTIGPNSSTFYPLTNQRACRGQKPNIYEDNEIVSLDVLVFMCVVYFSYRVINTLPTLHYSDLRKSENSPGYSFHLRRVSKQYHIPTKNHRCREPGGGGGGGGGERERERERERETVHYYN